MSLVGKVALITGASSGIGAATALRLSRIGASLVLTGRSTDRLDDVAKECHKAARTDGRSPITVAGDLTEETHVVNIVRQAMEHFGRLDVLVNCAGILEPGSIEDTTMEQYDRVMNTNVRAIYRTCMLAVPHLIQSKGNIVNVSSVNGIRAFPGVLAYNMSKAALDHFTRCTALELAPYGVRVNSVNPGVTVTYLHKTSGMDEEKYAAFLKHSASTHAMGRPGQPEEVANTIAYLCTDESSFTTGVCIPVDGGRHAMCPR